MLTILLGEAPRRSDGFAFDDASWTTRQLAAVVGVAPPDLNKAFYVQNVFLERQRRRRNGFDRFSVEEAAIEIDDTWFESRRIVCLGTRVAAALELALDIDEGAIPENRFARFDDTARGSGWMLARVPHPSGLRREITEDGIVFGEKTREFLRSASARHRQRWR